MWKIACWLSSKETRLLFPLRGDPANSDRESNLIYTVKGDGIARIPQSGYRTLTWHSIGGQTLKAAA